MSRIVEAGGAALLAGSMLLGCDTGPRVEPTPQPMESSFRCANGDFLTSEINLPGDRAVILDAIADSGIQISQAEIDLWKDCYNAGPDELPLFDADKPEDALAYGMTRVDDTLDRMVRSEVELFHETGTTLKEMRDNNDLLIDWGLETTIYYDMEEKKIRLELDPGFVLIDSSQLSLANILVPLGRVIKEFQKRIDRLGLIPTDNEIADAFNLSEDETIRLHSEAFGLRSEAWIDAVARLGESFGEEDKGFVEAAAQWIRVGRDWRNPAWEQFTFQNNPGLNQAS